MMINKMILKKGGHGGLKYAEDYMCNYGSIGLKLRLVRFAQALWFVEKGVGFIRGGVWGNWVIIGISKNMPDNFT